MFLCMQREREREYVNISIYLYTYMYIYIWYIYCVYAVYLKQQKICLLKRDSKWFLLVFGSDSDWCFANPLVTDYAWLSAHLRYQGIQQCSASRLQHGWSSFFGESWPNSAAFGIFCSLEKTFWPKTSPIYDFMHVHAIFA